MKWVRLALLAALLAAVTLRWPAALAARGVVPAFLLVPGLVLGLTAKPGVAAAVAFGHGLVADCLSLEPFGVHAFGFGAAALALARVRTLFFCDHALTQAGLSFLLSLLVAGGLLARLEIAEPSLRFARLLPGALAGAGLTALLVPLVAAVDARLGLFRGFRLGDPRVRT